MNVYGIPGLVLDIENWWGEDWLKVMFGTEIGWVMHSWVRLMEMGSRCQLGGHLSTSPGVSFRMITTTGTMNHKGRL
jgi:hypothetical protein